MSKEKITKWRRFLIIAILFSSFVGTLLHFTYEWSNKNIVIAAFSAVNESVWEHLKLVFFPMLVMSIVGFLWNGKEIKNYWCIRLFSMLIAISFITIFFYTYTGIIGQNYAILDIGSFLVAIVLGEYDTYKHIIKAEEKASSMSICIMTLMTLTVAFIIFTYWTPKINYFRDPITNHYGICEDKG
ncbi:MAG: DUF6512 family protein [Clostridia bacterium]